MNPKTAVRLLLLLTTPACFGQQCPLTQTPYQSAATPGVNCTSLVTAPAAIMAGPDTPVNLGKTCDATVASPNTTYLFNQTNLSTANSIWKCTYNPTTTAYSWIAPFTAAQQIVGATASFGGSLLILGGSVTSTATVTGAPVGSNCMATRADGTLLTVGLVIDCAVSTTGVATVRISALIAGTPAAGVYNVRVIL